MEKLEKKHRVQLTEAELKSTIYGLQMELDSIHTVWLDIKDDENEDEWRMSLELQHYTLSNIVKKLSNKLKK